MYKYILYTLVILFLFGQGINSISSSKDDFEKSLDMNKNQQLQQQLTREMKKIIESSSSQHDNTISTSSATSDKSTQLRHVTSSLFETTSKSHNKVSVQEKESSINSLLRHSSQAQVGANVHSSSSLALKTATKGPADDLLKNLLIVIAAVSIGLMVGIGLVVYFVWKSGLLGLMSKAFGVADPTDSIPAEAMNAVKEVGGEPEELNPKELAKKK